MNFVGTARRLEQGSSMLRHSPIDMVEARAALAQLSAASIPDRYCNMQVIHLRGIVQDDLAYRFFR